MSKTAQPIFRHTVRVPYAHTDQMRFVYYANYLVYFEMTRSEMLRQVGLPYGELEQRGILLPVAEAHCRYKSPAHFDDLLQISATCAINGARLRIDYAVTRDRTEIADGYTVHACVAPTGRVMRPPAELHALTAGRAT